VLFIEPFIGRIGIEFEFVFVLSLPLRLRLAAVPVFDACAGIVNEIRVFPPRCLSFVVGLIGRSGTGDGIRTGTGDGTETRDGDAGETTDGGDGWSGAGVELVA